METWKNNFERLFNLETEQTGNTQIFSTTDPSVDEPSMHEVKQAIKK